MIRSDPKFYQVEVAGTTDRLVAHYCDTLSIAIARNAKRFPVPRVRLIGKARRWPSVISPFGSHESLLVSQSLVAALDSSSLSAYKTAPVQHSGLGPLQLLLWKRPRYFTFDPLGKVSYYLRVYERFDDRYEFRFETADLSDPRLSEIRQHHGRYLYRRIPLLETWNGCDFFRLAGKSPTFGGFCCTRAFLDLVLAGNFSGFSFHPLDALDGSFVDVHSRPLPPSTWYPSRQPD